MKSFDLFDTERYKKRLRLLRRICNSPTQKDFAERLGIPWKRWNEYEGQGYPMPRETAFAIRQIEPGIIEWIWFGDEGSLPEKFRVRLHAAQKEEKQREKARIKQERETLLIRRARIEKAARKLNSDNGTARS